VKNGYTHGKLGRSDFMSGDVSVIANQYVKVGAYTCKAGEVIFMGYGESEDMHNAVGRVYAYAANATPAELKGTWLLQIESPQDIPLEVLGTWRSEDFNTSSTDKTKQLPWAMIQPGMSKDKKLCLYFKSDTTDTLKNTANTVISFDITRVLVN
jgi:hypothetical protein